jgi:hypothetical protein
MWFAGPPTGSTAEMGYWSLLTHGRRCVMVGGGLSPAPSRLLVAGSVIVSVPG